MKRVDLLAKLERAAPALAGTDIVPLLTHFWFSGTRVLAYNDQIGISVPLKSDIKGAVPGSLLLALLNASRAENVDINVDRDELVVKAASARFRLGMMDVEAFVFNMPKAPETTRNMSGGSRDEFLDGLDACLRSVSTDTSVPDQLGVTLIANGESLEMYSTNDSTMSHAKIKLKMTVGKERRAILPTAFCQQLLALAGEDKFDLAITDKYCLAQVGDTTLYGTLVYAEKPLDLAATLDRHLYKGVKDDMVPIPTKMKLILERAVIVTEAERATTSIVVADGKMRFASKTSHNEVTDVLQLDGKHPDVQIKLDAKLLRAGYGAFDKMLITEQCAIMAQDNTYYLVASRN